MALSPTPEEREATAVVFRERKAQEAQLQLRVNDTRPLPPTTSPDQEVEAALIVLSRLAELANGPSADLASAGESVSAVPVRGAPGVSDAGPEVERSAHVQRNTRRCTIADHLMSPRLFLAAVAGSFPFTADEFAASGS